ncbi:MAG: 2,3,4,5-tetrahydropyridine-2,6-dicarboxylate N-succinyltransferase [Candidatus Acidiferrales bacterium]|jgi:2,3,4,5-tetrahydropyridine-2-carboxylate N-succinyltransferase
MLQSQVEALFAQPKPSYTNDDFEVFHRFIAALNSGEIRSAEPDAASATGWRVNAWVKQGILLGFRMGTIVDMSLDASKQPFFDKSTFPVKRFSVSNAVRIVPGGSSVRTGAYVGKSVVCMPPMYINVGAYVDEGTTVDSHALIGSCAQIGKKCHISAGVQVGGVLEPVGALPVIIEDEVLAGGQSGIYEGVIVKRRAVLGTGTLLNASAPVYDIVRDQILTATESSPLIIPEGAVVVPGSRAITKPSAQKWGLGVYTPVIVKYRDEKTDSRIQLEDLIR